MKFCSKLGTFTTVTLTPVLFYSNPIFAETFNNINAVAMPAKQTAKESLFSLLVKGGPIMVPLCICSILALTFFIERLISLKKNRIVPNSFYPELTEKLDGFSKSGLKNSDTWCLNKTIPYCKNYSCWSTKMYLCRSCKCCRGNP